jgi:hypothetical protein
MDIDLLFLGALHVVFQSKFASFAHAIRLSWLQKWGEDPCLVSHRNLISFTILALALLYSILWQRQ